MTNLRKHGGPKGRERTHFGHMRTVGEEAGSPSGHRRSIPSGKLRFEQIATFADMETAENQFLRLDRALVLRGMAASRAVAQQLIARGAVLVNERVCAKASRPIHTDDRLAILEGQGPRYVSQGGLKLEAGLRAFALTCTGLRMLDIGASTGGFTDCALQAGAGRIYTIDVGTAQLAAKFLADERVRAYEQLRIQDVTLSHLEGQPVDAVVCDVSFISLGHILPHIARLLRPEGWAIVLVKPQFEVGPGLVNRQGVVRDARLHIHALARVIAQANEAGLGAQATTHSPLGGGRRNLEFLLYLRKGCQPKALDVASVVRNAHHALG